MSRKRRQYDDDDGRTIADMSGVTRPSLFGHMPGSAGEQTERPADRGKDTPYAPEEDLIPRGEQKWYILGVMKASLLIGLVFLAGLGLVIALMLLFWC